METTKRRFCLPVSHPVNLCMNVGVCVCVRRLPINSTIAINLPRCIAPSLMLPTPHTLPFRAHCHGASATVISSAISAYAAREGAGEGCRESEKDISVEPSQKTTKTTKCPRRRSAFFNYDPATLRTADVTCMNHGHKIFNKRRKEDDKFLRRTFLQD